MARGVWSGSINFGLVNVSVKALTAVRDHDVHFHQLEAATGARVGNQKVSKETGEPVESDDIEMGYEISSGRYVTFARQELEDLKPASTRVVEVEDFVALDAIDPVYFERTYWLAPTNDGAERAYTLLAAAMEESQQVGIGSVVMRNKQYLAAIRPLSGALAMSTMRFADEVIDITDMEEVPVSGSEPSAKELKLAQQIIDSLATDWDPERYHDTFTDELKGIIRAKDRGDEVTEREEPEETDAEVIDLMEALRASVDQAKAGRTKSGGESARKRASEPPSSKKAASKKAAPKKAVSKRAAPKKAASKKTASKQAAPKKAASRKAAPKKASSKRAPAKKTA